MITAPEYAVPASRRMPKPAALRTIHHQAGGAFFVAGETVQAAKPAP